MKLNEMKATEGARFTSKKLVEARDLVQVKLLVKVRRVRTPVPVVA